MSWTPNLGTVQTVAKPEPKELQTLESLSKRICHTSEEIFAAAAWAVKRIAELETKVEDMTYELMDCRDDL